MSGTAYQESATGTRGHEYVTGRAWVQTGTGRHEEAGAEAALTELASGASGVWGAVSGLVRNHPIALVCGLVGIGLLLEFRPWRR